MPSRSGTPSPLGVSIVFAADARRLLLLGQGLLEDPEGPASARRLLSVIEGLGFVQVDSINVLERAHHLTLHTRLRHHRHQMLVELLEEDRRLFEQWTHDASIIPLRWYRHWHPRFEQAGRRIRASAWWRTRMGAKPERLLERVLARVQEKGPVQSREFEVERAGRATDRAGSTTAASAASKSKGWWNWSPQKAALEYLWRTGALAVVRRAGFEKVYDLSQRVHPQAHAQQPPTAEEHLEWACASALERLGAATPRELAAFWNCVPLADARRWCHDAIRRGAAEAVVIASVDGTQRAGVARSDWRDRLAQAPNPPAMLRLLSPFDPLIRDRQRARECFGFDYRFEAFVPAAQRRHGYYVLPILEGERLTGRLSARHDRPAQTLRVDGLWWEPKVSPTPRRRNALDGALQSLAALVGAARIQGLEASRAQTKSPA